MVQVNLFQITDSWQHTIWWEKTAYSSVQLAGCLYGREVRRYRQADR